MPTGAESEPKLLAKAENEVKEGKVVNVVVGKVVRGTKVGTPGDQLENWG